jgi:hypothetical protein
MPVKMTRRDGQAAENKGSAPYLVFSASVKQLVHSRRSPRGLISATIYFQFHGGFQ